MDFFRQLKVFLIEAVLCFAAVVITLLLIIPAIIYCIGLAIYSYVLHIGKKIDESKSLDDDSQSCYYNPISYNEFEESDLLYDEENYNNFDYPY